MITARDRFRGMWWGAFVGDAVAMPVHGYVDQHAIIADYGHIADMLAPKEPYDSFVLAGYKPPVELSPEHDYIGEFRKEDWKSRSTHPHKHLRAGENTLPMFLALHMAASILEKGEFDQNAWLARYQAIMTRPNGHKDTFVPTIHRRFFENLAQGKDPEKNGVSEAHISDAGIFLAIYLCAYSNKEKAHIDIIRAIKKFSIGENTSSTALFLMDVITFIISGLKLEDVLYQKMNPDRHYALAYPYRRWIKSGVSDEQIAEEIGRTAELEKSIVLSLFLALKYQDDFEAAIIANTNIGGETTGRGALIGALIAGQYGMGVIPPRWIDAMVYSSEIAGCCNALMPIVFK